MGRTDGQTEGWTDKQASGHMHIFMLLYRLYIVRVLFVCVCARVRVCAYVRVCTCMRVSARVCL